MKKYWLFLLVFLLAALLLAGCAGRGAETDAATVSGISAVHSAESEDTVLDLSSPEAPADGVTYEDGSITIERAGVYRVSGALTGQLSVDADGPVELILDGISIIGQDALNIRSNDRVSITLAPGTFNILADTAPEAYTEPSGEASDESSGEAEPAEQDTSAEAEPEDPEGISEEEPENSETDAKAVIYSKGSLTIGGEGTLIIRAELNNGIQSKSNLTIANGTINVTAANNALKAAGSISIEGGQVNLSSRGDGFNSIAGRLAPGDVSISGGRVAVSADGRGIDAEGTTYVSAGELSIISEDDAIRADVISVTDGVLTVDAQGDGLQAATDLTVSGGTLSITTGGGGGKAIQHAGESFGMWGGSDRSEDDTPSTKGLKSDGSITVAGGSFALNNADDSIHCGTLFTMDGGSVTICSNDDAVHSDDLLVINDGQLQIDDCFEGLEAFGVEIYGGNVVIRAVNDGMNANGSMGFFRSDEQAEVTSLSGSSKTYVLIAGGKVDLVVTGNSSNHGDGIDSNGALYITGGESVVSTFGSFMEGGLDTGSGGPVVTGGMVIAGGSSSMAEGFSSSSTQCAAIISTRSMPDNTEVVLSDEDGNVIWSVVMADSFSCLQISHPDMQVGHVYTLTYGNQTTTLDFTNTNNISNSRGFGGFR